MVAFDNRSRCREKLKYCMAVAIMLFLTALIGIPAKIARADVAYGYIRPDSSRRYLGYDEISDMPLQVVCYAKNEIYARSGRRFHSTELQNYFDQQYWYVGIYSPEQFSDSMLNVYEIANIALLSGREEDLGTYQTDAGYYDYNQVYQYISLHSDSYASDDSYYVDPDSYILYDSDRRYLRYEETAQLTLQELCYAKNEIYARNGRMFQSAELRKNFFSEKLVLGDDTGGSVF